MKSTSHTCPVCSYPKLREAPRGKSGGASFEICPSCGFQFGVSDDDDGISYDEWRQHWVEEGMIWSSKGIPQPKGWKASVPLAEKAATKKAPAKKAAAKEAPVKKVAAKKAPANKAAVKKAPAQKAAAAKAPTKKSASKKAAKKRKA
ncbi:MAG: hypothetical protein KDK97_05970 [Verrucomicrobiales bacterium]|nr:hypothetical protein [Verrucomicrobiales bacterium]MCP5559606.1 hypothetical protein [Verrucomicrobiaceae bacterium]